MLFLSLNFLKDKLNQQLRNTKRWGENKAVVGSLNSDTSSSDDLDLVKLTLINIFQENSLKNRSGMGSSGDGFVRAAPPQSFNVDFLMSAHCARYDEALKLLSDCINYFQSNKYFDQSGVPDLPAAIDKLAVSVLDTELSEIINFWNCHGANYVPSIVYRMRLVTFDGNEIVEEVPAVSVPENMGAATNDESLERDLNPVAS